VLVKGDGMEDISGGGKIQEGIQECPHPCEICGGNFLHFFLSVVLFPSYPSSEDLMTPAAISSWHSSVTTVTEKSVGLFHFEALKVCILLLVLGSKKFTQMFSTLFKSSLGWGGCKCIVMDEKVLDLLDCRDKNIVEPTFKYFT
ncbi:hypothetical protein Hamer_G007429, partial [Homarus americanus]